jgi:hypothetical protein
LLIDAGALEISLGAVALLVGATGTFSPCGLSAIETIGPTGHTGGRRITVAASAAFIPGAIAGGALTFGLLALVGELLGAGSRASYLAAAALALLAAVLEAQGTRIVPQIRRQLPEQWRRLMPMPIAAALYGVLLGIGFTTFVLSFGVWALAGISLALGDPELGLLLGAGFGLGRALPIVALAPLAGRPAGIRATELMCERPGVYLGLRRGDAAALAAAALALVLVPGDAGARSVIASSATDPSATVDSLVFQPLAGGGTLRRGGDIPLPGNDPAIGGNYVAATVAADTVRLLDRGSLAPVADVGAPGADALAVSSDWLVYRAPLAAGGDGIFARSISDPGRPGPIQQVAGIGGSSQLSPPAVDGSNLLYAIATTSGSRVIRHTLGTQRFRALVRSNRLLLFDPAVKGKAFTYVRTEARRSWLLIRRFRGGGPGRVLLSLKRRFGQLWSSTLTEGFAFVTVLEPGSSGASARVVKVDRKGKRLRRRAPRGGGNHRY